MEPGAQLGGERPAGVGGGSHQNVGWPAAAAVASRVGRAPGGRFAGERRAGGIRRGLVVAPSGHRRAAARPACAVRGRGRERGEEGALPGIIREPGERQRERSWGSGGVFFCYIIIIIIIIIIIVIIIIIIMLLLLLLLLYSPDW